MGLLEYTFPSKTKIVNYLKDNLTCGAELAMEIHRRIGGHMGEVGALVARFQKSEPSPSEVFGEDSIVSNATYSVVCPGVALYLPGPHKVLQGTYISVVCTKSVSYEGLEFGSSDLF